MHDVFVLPLALLFRHFCLFIPGHAAPGVNVGRAA